jgi:hypothetical protein
MPGSVEAVFCPEGSPASGETKFAPEGWSALLSYYITHYRPTDDVRA